MKIDGTSWHCRVYQWWYRHKYENRESKTNSNLCPYMRAVMFWAPLRAIFGNWLKIWRVPVNAITLPAVLINLPFLLGYASYTAKCIAFVTYGVLAFFTLLFTFIWLVEDKKILRPVEKALNESSFLNLTGEYLRSAHDRVCPEVTWE